MKTSLLIAFLLSFFITGQTNAQTIRTIKLRELDGRHFSFRKLSRYRGSVIVFLEPDCPISQKYTLNLRQLRQRLDSLHIRLIAVYPMPYIKPAKVKAFAETYQLSLTHLIDARQKLTKLLQATTTPQVFLLNQKLQVIYTGLIDNWFYALGKSRGVITAHYLDDAIAAYLQHKPITIPKTEPVGCDIEIRTW
ncbi:MAG: redoxin domain-containing protein [Spirosomataceae bacterium]